MAEGLRLRLFMQAVAVWECWKGDWDPIHWIRTGFRRDRGDSAEDRQARMNQPEVMIARDQIRKDGGVVILEHVTQAVEAWRRSQEEHTDGCQ